MTRAHKLTQSESGFSLVEGLVAMTVLTIGLLALAQTFYLGMRHMATSSASVVAREKAREAIESVHTARDTKTIRWADLRNIGTVAGVCPAGTVSTGGGVFTGGEVVMRAAGVDGLVNTADDGAAPLEASPGPDNIMGTSDDIALTQYWRTVTICDVNGNNDLRQILVSIRYRVGPIERTYQLTTFISSFS
jgi:type II secretory pathway pseudopilin PulG